MSMASQMNMNGAGYPSSYVTGMAGASTGAACTFPAAPPRRVYCTPAPWSTPCCKHQNLLNAYGASRPSCGGCNE